MMIAVQAASVALAPADHPRTTAHSIGRGPLSPDLLTRPVLIIEDEAVIAWTLESVLEEMGFEQVLIAASGPDALRQAKPMSLGLIVSDINLGAGTMDGVAAAGAIAAGTETAVVFISGYASTDARARIARDMPNAMILRKPVSAADLHAAIASVTKQQGDH